MDLAKDLELAERAVLVAGEIVARHYARGPIAVETKADSSPVTEADRESNAAIVALLAAERPADAILSEESPDVHSRLANRRVWIVDPLDGTRDFVHRSGEFQVLVGLAIDGESVVGAMYQPTTGHLVVGSRGGGAWSVTGGTRAPIRVSSTRPREGLAIGISRQKVDQRVTRALAAAGLEGIAMGASVKHAALAEGKLDAILALSGPGGEHEWDTCACDVVIREAGGLLTDPAGQPFRYNQPDPAHADGSIASNGACHQIVLGLVSP